MKRKMEISKETVPMIFQVRSSLANFLKSTFSSLSFCNFWDAGFFLAAAFGAFSAFSYSGFSAAFGVLDFSLLAIKTKIRIHPFAMQAGSLFH